MVGWWMGKLLGLGFVVAIFFVGSQSSAYSIGSNLFASPLTADEINSKAEGLYNDGMKRTAIQLWKGILDEYPGYLVAKNNLATAYFNDRQFKHAAEQFFEIIEDDTILWKYPDARFLGPLAYYRQFATIEDSHGGYLEQYLASGGRTFRDRAEALRLLAVDRIASERLDVRTMGSIHQQLVKSNRSIVHFWAEWCNPCIKELNQLFRFSVDNPEIIHLVISVDAEGDKGRADRQLNALFSPYKADKKSNIRFIHDAKKALWKIFIPQSDQQTQTVPRTVFLSGNTLVSYSRQPVSWENLDLMTIWSD